MEAEEIAYQEVKQGTGPKKEIVWSERERWEKEIQLMVTNYATL